MDESPALSPAGGQGEHTQEGEPERGPRRGARIPARPRGRNVRLDDAITYFLGQWPAEGATRATVRTYGSQLKWLAAFAASRGQGLLADLTPDLLRAAMVAKMADRSTPTSKGGEAAANSLAFAARCLATWLRNQGVPVADLKVVRPRRPPERVQPRLWPHEFEALESAILRRLVDARVRNARAMVARDLALIYMLAESGLRASEVCAMTVHDVDFERGAVLVLRGKGSKQRALSIVGLPDDDDPWRPLRLLGEWLEIRSSVRNTDEHLFLWTSMSGRPLTQDQLREVLRRTCRDAGLPENRPPHAFRRMNFTEAYKANPAAIRVIADRMGWSPKSVSMISIYTRGAEIDLARTTPMGSVTGRWRRAPDPKVPVTPPGYRPILLHGADPPGGMTNGRAAQPLTQRRATPTASQIRRSGPAPRV